MSIWIRDGKKILSTMVDLTTGIRPVVATAVDVQTAQIIVEVREAFEPLVAALAAVLKESDARPSFDHARALAARYGKRMS